MKLNQPRLFSLAKRLNDACQMQPGRLLSATLTCSHFGSLYWAIQRDTCDAVEARTFDMGRFEPLSEMQTAVRYTQRMLLK